MDGGRVLLVEDEPALCALLERYLLRRGFMVARAENAIAARAALERTRDGFSACLIDMLLPDASGLDLAVEILYLFPDTHIVLMSGNPIDPERLALPPDAQVDFLHKPFRPAELGRVLGVLE